MISLDGIGFHRNSLKEKCWYHQKKVGSSLTEKHVVDQKIRAQELCPEGP